MAGFERHFVGDRFVLAVSQRIINSGAIFNIGALKLTAVDGRNGAVFIFGLRPRGHPGNIVPVVVKLAV